MILFYFRMSTIREKEHSTTRISRAKYYLFPLLNNVLYSLQSVTPLYCLSAHIQYWVFNLTRFFNFSKRILGLPKRTSDFDLLHTPRRYLLQSLWIHPFQAMLDLETFSTSSKVRLIVKFLFPFTFYKYNDFSEKSFTRTAKALPIDSVLSAPWYKWNSSAHYLFCSYVRTWTAEG